MISINEYSIEDLKEKLKKNNKNTILKLALINKISKLKETEVIIKEMKNIKIEENEIDYIASYIFERISKKIGKDVASLMIKNIEENFENEKEEKNMLEAFVDRFLEEGEKRAKKEIKEKIEKERKESISQIAINMLKEKCDKSLIKRCTGLSYAKINELEKKNAKCIIDS